MQNHNKLTRDYFIVLAIVYILAICFIPILESLLNYKFSFEERVNIFMILALMTLMEQYIKNEIIMNNQMLIDDAIKTAYGEDYEYLKPIMDRWGWCKFDNLGMVIEGKPAEERWQKYSGKFDNKNEGTRWRPISLRGLENNNGWTLADKLENSDILKGARYEVIHLIHGHMVNVAPEDVISFLEYGQITHHKIFNTSKLPVYGRT